MRFFLVWLVWWAMASAVSAAAPPDATSHAIRRGLDRLRAGAASYTEKRQCFSCHHQALTVAALAEAKRRGFAIDEALLEDQVRFTLASFTPKLGQIRKGQSVPGGNTMTAYGLFTLQKAKHPSDDTTSALVEYLVVRQHADGSWPALMPRSWFERKSVSLCDTSRAAPAEEPMPRLMTPASATSTPPPARPRPSLFV